MQIKSQVAWLPKAGCEPDEYEDAFWPIQDVVCSADAFSFAIADGATEASFSGLWARMLTRAWCKGWLSEKRIDQYLPKLQQRWLETVNTDQLPWYAEMKLAQGAFATLLGLRLRERGVCRGRWHAMVVGDCLLVQVSGGEWAGSFPVVDAAQFGSNPQLIGSRPDLVKKAKHGRICTSGEWLAGDRFYLLTDAVAAWMLKDACAGGRPWELLDAALSAGTFQAFVGDLRSRRKIRNDDVTVIRVELA